MVSHKKHRVRQSVKHSTRSPVLHHQGQECLLLDGGTDGGKGWMNGRMDEWMNRENAIDRFYKDNFFPSLQVHYLTINFSVRFNPTLSNYQLYEHRTNNVRFNSINVSDSCVCSFLEMPKRPFVNPVLMFPDLCCIIHPGVLFWASWRSYVTNTWARGFVSDESNRLWLAGIKTDGG